MAVEEFVFVYDADGTVVGELRYWFSTLLGGPHCSLCDITHGRFRQRRAFREGCEDLSASVTLKHRDDLAREGHADLAEVAAGRFPCVLARVGDEVRLVFGPERLEGFHADTGAFLTALAQWSPDGTTSSGAH